MTLSDYSFTFKPMSSKQAPPRRPTLRDVAKEAGVSVQTVSNVLQGRHNLMRGDTRERVEATVKKLGYHPNIAARGLRSLRTRTFGFLVLDEAPSFLADPLTDLLIAGVADVARDRGYEILLKAERPLSPERELLRPLHEARVDGAFVLMSGEPEMRHSYIAELQQLNTPFVVFDEVLENGEMVVRSNDRASARELTELMISRGRRDIAFIGARIPWPVVEQRHLGYRDALEAAGIEVRPDLELFDATWQAQGGEVMLRRLLECEPRPDAVFCGSDVLAIGAMHAAKASGLRVPEDLAIAGFDDFEFSRLIDPPLTTVRVPAYEMGRTAAEMLAGVLEGTPTERSEIVLDNELVVRSSI